MARDTTPSIVGTLAVNGHTVLGKPPLDQQFAELAMSYVKALVEDDYHSQTFRGLLRNLEKWSPKMRCWLFRELTAHIYEVSGKGSMMPSKTKNGSEPVVEQAWGFVNVQLTEDEREAAQVAYADVSNLWEHLIIIVKDGYKLTLSYDAETDSFCAALSGVNCGKPNERFTLTAWGADETEALQYLAYKHISKLDYIWNKPGAKQPRLG